MRGLNRVGGAAAVRTRFLAAILLAAFGTGTPARIGAQTCAAPQDGRDSVHVVRGWELLAVAGGTGALYVADQSIFRFLQDNRSKELDAVAGVFKRFGDAKVYGAVSLGVLGAGIGGGDREVRRAGGRLVASYLVTAAAVTVIKKLVGRSRPDAKRGAWSFEPFRNRQESFPSGHTALAFGLASSMADDIGSTWASIGLYAMAAGTAWSRLNDGRHWPSDVLAGAGLGLATAKVVSGRWRLFGVRAPEWLRTGDVVGRVATSDLKIVPTARSLGCPPPLEHWFGR